ncbi:MAG: hypothetical protein GX279_09980 [Clostridiaceae bacterium]|nr:hypothetical protein [Clostridiaceae bacterium]
MKKGSVMLRQISIYYQLSGDDVPENVLSINLEPSITCMNGVQLDNSQDVIAIAEDIIKRLEDGKSSGLWDSFDESTIKALEARIVDMHEAIEKNKKALEDAEKYLAAHQRVIYTRPEKKPVNDRQQQ